jgi:hypothetical protein
MITVEDLPSLVFELYDLSLFDGANAELIESLTAKVCTHAWLDRKHERSRAYQLGGDSKHGCQKKEKKRVKEE